MPVPVCDAELLFRPEDQRLRYLPEGPCACGRNRLSWVAIQHGPDAKSGSLNMLDTRTRTNQTIDLAGRPGFAFPTRLPTTWVIGLERQLGLLNVQIDSWTVLVDGIDDDVEDTIINDGVVFSEGVVFGTKHLEFTDKRAGLYLWRRNDRKLIRLRNDQICSNGKVVFAGNEGWILLDIDSPTQTIVSYLLDADRGRLGASRIVVDLRGAVDFPRWHDCHAGWPERDCGFLQPDRCAVWRSSTVRAGRGRVGSSLARPRITASDLSTIG